MLPVTSKNDDLLIFSQKCETWGVPGTVVSSRKTNLMHNPFDLLVASIRNLTFYFNTMSISTGNFKNIGYVACIILTRDIGNNTCDKIFYWDRNKYNYAHSDFWANTLNDT